MSYIIRKLPLPCPNDANSHLFKGAPATGTERFRNLIGVSALLINPIEIPAIIPDPVVCVDLDLQITYASPKALDVFGYSADELPGTSIAHLFSPETQTECMRRLQTFAHVAATRQTTPLQFEGEGLRKGGGDTFPIEISAGRLTRQETLWIALIFHDISRRRAREAAYLEAEASFQAVVQAAPLAVYSLDTNGNVQIWNPASERIFGWTQAEVIGRPPPTVPAEDRGEYAALFRKCLRGESLSGIEVRRRCKDGRTIDTKIFTAPLLDPSGEIVGTMAMLEDITERKAAEQQLNSLYQQLKVLNQTLEQRVQERTAEAEQRAEELARTNAELEQFAYVASHDLQEPLRMVASYTKLLARRYQGRLDDDADEFIGYAVNGATRMQKLINDLLTYSRLGTHGKPFQPVECREVLDIVYENLRASIDECNAIIEVGPLPRIQCDASQLTQLFQNLIANALKFRSERQPVIEVTARPRGGDWVFTVQDNGIGIEAAYKDQIFEIFQRLHTREEYPGTGIGLAICKKIVERHGGSIWLESSEPGQGSVFAFTISTAKGSSAHECAPVAQSSAHRDLAGGG